MAKNIVLSQPKQGHNDDRRAGNFSDTYVNPRGGNQNNQRQGNDYQRNNNQSNNGGQRNGNDQQRQNNGGQQQRPHTQVARPSNKKRPIYQRLCYFEYDGEVNYIPSHGDFCYEDTLLVDMRRPVMDVEFSGYMYPLENRMILVDMHEHPEAFAEIQANIEKFYEAIGTMVSMAVAYQEEHKSDRRKPRITRQNKGDKTSVERPRAIPWWLVSIMVVTLLIVVGVIVQNILA